MSLFIAQLTEAEVCGAGADSNWFCQAVFRLTENDLAARAATNLSSVVMVVAITVGAFVISRLLGRLVLRFAGRMESRIEERLSQAQRSGAIGSAERYRTRRLQRLQAIAGVLRGVVATVVWLIALLMIVGVLGIQLQPILAGAGLLGVVIGFGAQQLVRDVLAGIAMLIEDQYGVGDWIEVEGVFGHVERVGLRSTAFRDVDGVLHHQLNGSMQRVGNLSKEWARSTLDVPLALDADIPSAKAVIYKAASDLADDPVWGQDIIGPPEIWGVQDFGPAGIKIRVAMPTKPLRNWDVTRQLRERLKTAFEQANLRMPSQLIEVGGQRAGYALTTRAVDGGEDAEWRPRRRVAARHGDDTVDRQAAPPVTPGDDTGQTEGVEDRTKNPTGDLTTELRIEQGPRAHPD